MTSRNSCLRLQSACALALFSVVGIVWTARVWQARAADGPTIPLEASFERQAGPFLKQHCVQCHNADVMTSGVRVDHLDATLQDRHLRLWEAVRKKIGDETMPPKELPQPTTAERQEMVEWITRALDVARSRPDAKERPGTAPDCLAVPQHSARVAAAGR